MTIVTNFLIFTLSIFAFKNLRKYNTVYSSSMGWFLLLVGISSCFGSVAHAVHYQAGELFFNVIFYIMNALSLISVYFCFNAPYTYYNINKASKNKVIPIIVMAWIGAVLIYTLIQNNFLIVKIHAGIVLLYSFITHLMIYIKTKEKGSGVVVLGIGISFLSIIIHSLKFSIHEWFNYKDLAHVVISVTIFYIYKGASIVSEKLIAKKEN